ncbi:hypothetical protein DV735_g3692, partial [Chaetothyriales sp. CBS 134920]
MIIYTDLLTGDEVFSDTYKVKDVGNGLWEIDGALVTVGNENIQLEGANPSAEGEDAEEGGESGGEKKLDLEHNFRWVKIEGLDKKSYTGDIKKYMKALVEKLKEVGKGDDEIKEFQTGAAAAVKKILGNWSNYDVYKGESLGDNGMYFLVDYREDGVTPYATIFKHGLGETKV